MALSIEVRLAVEALIEMGVLREEGLVRLAGLFEGLKAFSSSFPSKEAPDAQSKPKGGYYRKADFHPMKSEPQLPEEQKAGENAERDDKLHTVRAASWTSAGNGHAAEKPVRVEEQLEEPDPEFTQELPGAYGQTGFEPQERPARKPLEGFAPGYSASNLSEKSVTVLPRKRAPNGSFNLPAEELQKLREIYTVKQIATTHGVSPATVNNKLREFGLTDPSKGRPARK